VSYDPIGYGPMRHYKAFLSPPFPDKACRRDHSAVVLGR
jgi:hypothetical protein